ncbi:tripartite tricarboxylate transporter substrate binding protein [Mesorhizobium sp. ZC-5]|uniref:tripartite tricarboxylate transporter substrate binding protein n=1 Tax=Mesorhizobium sp. ZC-5 TaxID=2986066 RepID=UPI0021E6F88E|nr:tripartite tricarboxylate transporter substrate binding protein [Mesorhizobium sp. ZC-5]MCV3242483.1 tripartite tricarboxylate transporter substrate binding protein [Mesorhizobium sp. ZC-5]
MRTLKILLAAATATSMLAGPAMAEYPEQPVTFIIPYGPGGTSDVGARTWGPFMEKCLGQPVVFVNKPGAGGELGFAELANAKPDGYTIGALNVPNFPAGAITKESPPYKLDSFAFLGNLYGSIVTINAKKGGKYKTLEEVVAAAKAGQVNMGISNFGADDHIKMLAFMKAADAKFTFIPMTDAAASRNAVIGGHVDVSGNSMTEVAQFQNELQTLAIASPERRPELPDVPTFKEQGYEIFGGSNHVLGAPAATPPEVVEKLSTCFSQVAADPEFQKVAKERTLLLNVMNGKETADWVAKESEMLKALWESDRWLK